MSKDIAPAVARGFIERATELQLKGKKRDDAALDYVIGAAKAAEALGNTDANSRLAMMAYLISIRGYSEVVTFAKLER